MNLTFHSTFFFNFSAGIHARSVKKVGQYVLQDEHEYVYDTYTIRTAGTMDVKTHSAGEAFRYKTRIQKKGKTFNVEVSELNEIGNNKSPTF